MSWDEAKFNRFLEATLRMARGELPGYGYPHVVVPYAPEDEMTCIATMRLLPARLSHAGFSHLLISVAQMVARATARYARRELPEAYDYRLLQADLADPRSGVVVKTAEVCAAEIRARGSEDTVVLCTALARSIPLVMCLPCSMRSTVGGFATPWPSRILAQPMARNCAF